MKYDYKLLNELTDLINKNIDKIIDYFKISIIKQSTIITGKCPIHQGDKLSSFHYYINSNRRTPPKWRCYSHHCEHTFKDTAIGFVRGLLSAEDGWREPGNKVYPFNETIEWLIKFFQVENTNFCDEEKIDWQDKQEVFVPPPPKIQLTYDQFSDMIYPSKYFKGRGFSAETLEFFQVGYPRKPIEKFYFREFVPIYDEKGEFIIGATCRSVFEKCKKCTGFHDTKYKCPRQEIIGAYTKWKNWNVNRAYSLYNLWNAYQPILNSKSIILVESPGNVWRLWEAGIFNCIASYGTELSFGQITMLKNIGVNRLYLLYDNDKPGQLAFKRNGEKLWQDFYIYKMVVPSQYNDVGDIANPQYLHKIIMAQYDKTRI